MLTSGWWLVERLIGWLRLPAVQERAWDWGGHPMWGVWGVWGLGMMAFMFLFWIVVLVGFVLALRWLFGQGKASRPDPALDILRQRYARGEIGKDEFDAKKRDLGA